MCNPYSKPVSYPWILRGQQTNIQHKIQSRCKVYPSQDLLKCFNHCNIVCLDQGGYCTVKFVGYCILQQFWIRMYSYNQLICPGARHAVWATPVPLKSASSPKPQYTLVGYFTVITRSHSPRPQELERCFCCCNINIWSMVFRGSCLEGLDQGGHSYHTQSEGDNTFLG